MKKKFIWLVGSILMVLVLLVAACAPAPAKEVAPKEAAPAVKEAAPVVKEVAPVVKEAAPAVKEAAAAVTAIGAQVISAANEVIAPGRETVKVTLTKLDGTPVELLVEKPQYGGRLTIMRPDAVYNWDETLNPPWTTLSYMDWTHEELLVGDWKRGPAGTNELSWKLRGWWATEYQIGQLAESWEIPDNTTIIFKIRKGVRWHNRPPVNGRELNANDVVYSLRRIFFDNPTAPMYTMAGDGRPLDIYATDKYTVVAKTRPGFHITTLEYIAGWTRIFPPEVEKLYGVQDEPHSIGTGPFMKTDYVPMSSVTYGRNPDYWDTDHILGKDYRLPYLDTIKILTIPDLSTQMAAMRTGKVDICQAINWEDARSLRKTAPHLLTCSYAADGSSYFGGRLDKNLPFNDIRVRRALMMAINKQEVVALLYGGDATILARPVAAVPEWARAYTPIAELPLSSDGFDNKKLYGYYPEEAKKLLAEAGYPNGFKTKIVYVSGYGYGVSNDDALSMVKNYWAAIGVDLELKPSTSAVGQAVYLAKTYDEMFLRGWAAYIVHQWCLFRKDNTLNTAIVNDPKMDQYYDKISAAPFRGDEWWKTLKEMNLYAIDRVYYNVLPVGYQHNFWQPWLRRYYGEVDIGPYKYTHMWMKHAWIDQELKKSMGY